MEGLQNSPLWDGEDRRTRRRKTKIEGARASQQGGLPLAQLPGPGLRRELLAPYHSLPLPPRAPWLLSLPAGPPPSQTAARGRGRSISEQRGPCGLQFKSRIPLSHRQVKRGVRATCTQACRHGTRAPGAHSQRAWDATERACPGASWGRDRESGPV